MTRPIYLRIKNLLYPLVRKLGGPQIWIRNTKMQNMYEGVFKSFRTGCLKEELQLVQLSATKCSFIAILWVSLMSFATMTLCVASQRVFVVVVVVVVDFVIDSVRKLLNIASYCILTSLHLLNYNEMTWCVIICSLPDIIRAMKWRMRWVRYVARIGEVNKVKVKVQLCLLLTKYHFMKTYLLFNQAQCHKDVLGNGCIAPRILDLGTKYRWMVRFTPRP
jgi:hypothetical protein